MALLLPGKGWKVKPPAFTVIDLSNPLTKGLIAAYNFNDQYANNTLEAGRWTVRDSLGGAPLTFESSNSTPNTYYPYWKIDGQEGPHVYSGDGTDFSSDGIYNSYLAIPDSLVARLNGQASATLILRIKCKDAGTATSGYLLGLTGNSTLDFHYPYSDGTIYSQAFLASVRNTFTPSSTVNRGGWHNIAIVSTPNRYEFYQNNISLGTGTPESTVTVNTNSHIGGSALGTPGGNDRSIAVSQALFFNRGLSTSEIAALSYEPWSICLPQSHVTRNFLLSVAGGAPPPSGLSKLTLLGCG